MSRIKLKPIEEQVIVITGASSGIGLATATLAAHRGASVVLAARSETALAEFVEEITRLQGVAVAVVCDVTDRAQVDRVVQTALDRFGCIDTWVNNAGVSIYGKIEEISEEDSKRLFDVNFWGVYHGSLAALPHLKKHGGALINVGSEVSETVVPMQGMYAASKQAVRGFTDALRFEVRKIDNAPVAVTLIQPTATDTPFPQHARNYMQQEPKLPFPLVDPKDVAEAILDAAVRPTRSKKIGAISKMNAAISKIAPLLTSSMAAQQDDQQQSEEPPRHPEGTLEEAGELVSSAGDVHGSEGYQAS